VSFEFRSEEIFSNSQELKMKGNNMKKIALFIFIISISGCEEELSGPEKFPFNENFYQKFSGITASYCHNYPYITEFTFDNNNSFIIKTDGTFTLKISGYKNVDSTNILYENSGTIEVLSKSYDDSGELAAWKGKLNINWGNDSTSVVDYSLTNFYSDVWLTFMVKTNYLFIKTGTNTGFEIWHWMKNYRGW
jgi:hypothetical protein